MPSPAPDGTLNVFEVAYGDGVVEDGSSMPITEGCAIGGARTVVAGSTASSATSTSSSWMEKLAKLGPNTRYRDLLVVGSHDAASSTIAPHRPFSAIARCQNLSVVEQLESGIRLLDLRVGSRSGSGRHSDVFVWHGSLEGGPFLPVLHQIDMFVTDHPKEVVILNLVPEYGVSFTDDQKLFILKRINEMFRGRLVTAKEMKHLLSHWTLRDLSEKGKCVIVLFHPRFCQDLKVSTVHGSANGGTNPRKNHSREWTEAELEAEFDVVNADVWMRNLWFNTRNTNGLFDMVLQDIRLHGKKKNHHLYCSQFVLTPGVGGLVDVMKALAGTNPLRPMSLSQQLYKNHVLNDFLRQNASQPWNLFLLDFVDYCPWTVRFLTSLNFPVPVTVCLAVYSDGETMVNVTQKIAEYTYRERAIFLTDIVQDLELQGQRDEGSSSTTRAGTLIVAYRLGHESYYVLSAQAGALNQPNLLLISYYATSAASVVKVHSSDEGIIHGGRILNIDAPVRNLDGIIIRFKNATDKCVFEVME